MSFFKKHKCIASKLVILLVQCKCPNVLALLMDLRLPVPHIFCEERSPENIKIILKRIEMKEEKNPSMIMVYMCFGLQQGKSEK